MEKNVNGVKILYLYSEIMGYTLSVLTSLALDHNCQVFVIYWNDAKQKKSSFHLNEKAYPITFFKRTEFTKKKIKELINLLNPKIICVSGWMDQLYLEACRYARKKNIITVSLIDTQWRNTFRQHILSWLSFVFVKRHFQYMWVAGVYQYEYSRRLGYKRNKIITGILTADTDKFEEFYNSSKETKKKSFPHVFLYAGRLIKRKGLEDLVKAYQNTLKLKAHDWKLVLIGDGILKEKFKNIPQIIVKDFIQPDKFIDEIKTTGVFCLPSRFEPWGVVVHEFATAGFPLITSDECGAATEFVRSGYNGYTFPTGDINKFTDRMMKIINTSDDKLFIMGERSSQIAKHITPLMNSSLLLNILQE